MEKEFIKKATTQSGKTLLRAIPIIIPILLLVSLLSQLLTKESYTKFFTGGFFDPLIGSVVGSISVGAPVISYIISGEMLNQGVSLIAVTAFIVSWVSVGVVSSPIEIKYFGKKFTIARNLLSFIFSIIIAISTVAILNLI